MRPTIIQIMSGVHKNHVKFDETQINLLFCENPMLKPVRSNRIPQK